MQLAALFRIELLKIYHWFKTNSLAKVAVIAGFLVVISALLIGELMASYYYFQFLSQQEDFGLPIIQYSLNAAVLLIFILTVSSSIGTTYLTLYRSSHIAHLITTPVTISRLLYQNSISTFLPSVIISLLLLPLFISSALQYGIDITFVIRIIFVLITLSITAHAIGSTITHVIAHTLGNRSLSLFRFAWILIIFVFIFLIQSIFPPSFRKLYFAPDLASFQEQYMRLPLVSMYISTNWWAYTITLGQSILLIPIITLTCSFVGLNIYAGKTLFINGWRNHFQNLNSPKIYIKNSQHTKHFPRISSTNPSIQLLINEFLVLFRSPSEINYVAFLGGMALIIIVMIKSLPLLQSINSDFLPILISIAWAGITHLFLLLAARIYYPSISRLKRVLWFQFSLPIARTTQLHLKLIQVTLISCISILLGIISANFLNIYPLPFTIIIWLTVTNISLTQLLWGVVAPNFNESENPEAASTSGSGVLALLHSIYLLSSGGYLILLWVSSQLTGLEAILYLIATQALTTIPLYFWARHNIHTYKL